MNIGTSKAGPCPSDAFHFLGKRSMIVFPVLSDPAAIGAGMHWFFFGRLDWPPTVIMYCHYHLHVDTCIHSTYRPFPLSVRERDAMAWNFRRHPHKIRCKGRASELSRCYHWLFSCCHSWMRLALISSSMQCSDTWYDWRISTYVRAKRFAETEIAPQNTAIQHCRQCGVRSAFIPPRRPTPSIATSSTMSSLTPPGLVSLKSDKKASETDR